WRRRGRGRASCFHPTGPSAKRQAPSAALRRPTRRPRETRPPARRATSDTYDFLPEGNEWACFALRAFTRRLSTRPRRRPGRGSAGRHDRRLPGPTEQVPARIIGVHPCKRPATTQFSTPLPRPRVLGATAGAALRSPEIAVERGIVVQAAGARFHVA